MQKLTRFIALGGVALLAALAPIGSAQAATIARAATITSVETIGGVQVVYNAEAVQVTPGAGAVAMTCEAIGVPVLTGVWTTCWVTNLDTGEVYSGPSYGGRVGISGEATANVVTSGSRLQLCMLVDRLFVGADVFSGPVRCELLD